MSHTQPVARTDLPQSWPEGLRISDATPASLASSEIASRPHWVETLRTTSAYLQAGWRWLERKRTQQLSSRRLRVAETISLGEKRSVSIVQVDGAQFLIGCSTGSVQLLAVLDRENYEKQASTDIERAS